MVNRSALNQKVVGKMSKVFESPFNQKIARRIQTTLAV